MIAALVVFARNDTKQINNSHISEPQDMHKMLDIRMFAKCLTSGEHIFLYKSRKISFTKCKSIKAEAAGKDLMNSRFSGYTVCGNPVCIQSACDID